MGSSLPHALWIVIAAICGVLYLIFDAARAFALQLSPVTRRRWASDPALTTGRWFRYDPRNVQLISGALLQIVLILAFAATALSLERDSVVAACALAAVIWIVVVVGWKFCLGFVPEDTGETILRRLIPITTFFYYVFWPVLYPLRRLLRRLDREDEDDDDDEEVTDETVQAYINVGEEEGILEGTEGQLIQSIVDFGDRVARELMTPRIDVLAVDSRTSLAELGRLFSESKYSRIPIFQESIDRITGIVHIKEVFDAVVRSEDKAIAELARPPYFVSETKKVSELLREFQSEHLQVAVVVDEYGGTAGLITIEDVVEEIVGDIADEHEDEEATVVDIGDGVFLVSGLLRVEELEQTLDADLAGEDYETVAGLIFTTLGRVPKVGAVVTKNGFRFEVDRADRRRIYRVRVSRDPDWNREEEEERE